MLKSCSIIYKDVASVLTPRFEAVSRRSSASAGSRLGWNFKRLGLASASRLKRLLGLGLRLDTEGLGLGLSLGSKRLGLVGKHFSNYAWICHFGSASVLGFPHFFQSSEWCGCGMWPRSWRLGLEDVSRRSSASARSRLGVGTPRPRLGLELWRPWSRCRLGLNCQRLSLGLGLQGLGLASVSTKRPRAHPWLFNIILQRDIVQFRVPPTIKFVLVAECQFYPNTIDLNIWLVSLAWDYVFHVICQPTQAPYSVYSVTQQGMAMK